MKHISTTLISLLLLCSTSYAAKVYKHVSLHSSHVKASSLELTALNTVKRIINEKAAQTICQIEAPHLAPKSNTLHISLVKKADDKLGEEGYKLSLSRDTIRVEAKTDHGLMYGVGKALHSTYTDQQGIQITHLKQGISLPEKSVRGIYLATHFHNFYNDAPIKDVEHYIEELALWGYNGLQVWFDMHHYKGIDDPQAQQMLQRLKILLRCGERMGMKNGLTMLANESYNTTPKELRSEKIDWTGFFGCEICPSKPGGTELILKQREEMLNEFDKLNIPIDNIWLWPYDQGGCSCKECSPWGANAYVKLTKQLAKMLRQRMPDLKLVLSTWLFDFEEQDKGEWKGLAQAMKTDKPWVDYIMADSHTLFPRYLLNNPVPGNLPLLNFPEISMWENWPWGGYGANPQPLRFQKLWREMSQLSEGGYPYSEGKFEDFNKVLYSQFYWESQRTGTDIMKEYISYEYSPALVSKIAEAILIMEKNMGPKGKNWRRDPKLGQLIELPTVDAGSEKAWRIMQAADKQLAPTVKKSWRWRIMYLRAFIDYALRQSKGVTTPEINKAFWELIEISHLQQGGAPVRPPVID